MIGELDLEVDDLYGVEVSGEQREHVSDTEEGGVDAGDHQSEQSDKDGAQASKDGPSTSKRVKRNPQPKLNPERLCGDRGIAQLPKIFSGFKPKGKGHEKEDLDGIMKTLEHWCHRLFPKLPFDDVLERIEKLGTKRAVQTCIKRIRLDMPVLSSDNLNGTDDEIDDDDDDISSAVIDGQLHATLFANPPLNQQPNATAESSGANAEDAPKFTKEQEERMKRNRQLALERRAAHLQAVQSNATINPADDTLSSPTDSVPALGDGQTDHFSVGHDQNTKVDNPKVEDHTDTLLTNELLDVNTETFLLNILNNVHNELNN